MRRFIMVAAVSMLSATSALAQTATINTSTAVMTAKHHAAPGSLLGAGPVGLVAGGIGYGIYWLRKRRRKAG